VRRQAERDAAFGCNWHRGKAPSPLRSAGAVQNLAAGAAAWFFILHSSFCLRAWGQSYSLDWYKISGGGGASTGATYQVTGTIGQPDAGSAMSGGQYSVTGGFWSLIAVVQTAGAPMLTIAHSGNSVTVSWPLGAGGFALQQNNNVANSAGWSPYGGTVNTTNSVSSITISPPTGNLFFRLSHP
jgi:hypothetical protein